MYNLTKRSTFTHLRWVSLSTNKTMMVVIKRFNVAVNDFGAEKSISKGRRWSVILHTAELWC